MAIVSFHRHLLFGYCLETDYPFRTPMTAAPSDMQPDLRFHLTHVTPPPTLLEETSLYQSPDKNRFGERVVQAYAAPAGIVMRFPRIADFWLSAGEIRCELHAPALEYMVEICLLGHVMAYYLELSGVAAIHAGAVVVDDRAVLFAADRTGGKSTLVASLVEAGIPLLADDISALHYHDGSVVCRHGFPQMKLTPEQAGRFVGETDTFPLVHPAFAKLSVPAGRVGRVASATLPVACIYLLERRLAGDIDAADGAVRIDPVAAGEAMIQLVRHSFLVHLFDAHAEWPVFAEASEEGESRLHASRFQRLARIAQSIPIKRLWYPSGYAHLPAVHEAVRLDLHASTVNP
ncbi:hypothetical protein HOP52_00720 [Halomonas campisalis]|uniref:HPr kinase n=1 Tax=Billgrantia campisalis TaxID=74661 RepID=A0ABS9P3C7_9GAMM|nr:hypothetical protein [Halomonas campisalis]MCG6656300.1 hypothetical protein [Halomonas campisalis]MDR5861487.1 hypothetical protein [Halomonas campisalis]